jgi:hypothetical protein
LTDAASLARAGGNDAVRKMHDAAQRTEKLHAPLLDLLAVVGQHQLLRRRIHRALNLHAALGASLALEALGAVDQAETTEDVSASQEVLDQDLPSVWDFVGAQEASPEELLARFHRRLSRAGDLPGLSDPLRTIYVMIPEGSIPAGFDVLVALALVSPSAKSTIAGSKVAPKAAATDKSRRGGQPAPAEATGVSSFRYTDANAALLAGVASLLQQLPRTYKDEVIHLCGAHIVAVCASQDKDLREVGESARLVELLGDLLGLLGLPREQLAEVVPQGLLDLLPVESG